MGWSFRKSLRVLPGIRINLSRSGPRLSVGVPGARASINLQGMTRIYGGMGPLHYQKAATIERRPQATARTGGGLRSLRLGLIRGGRS